MKFLNKTWWRSRLKFVCVKLCEYSLFLRYHDTIERYCDETDSWEIVGEMPTSRSWLSCVSLQMRKESHAAGHPGTAAETEFPVD